MVVDDIDSLWRIALFQPDSHTLKVFCTVRVLVDHSERWRPRSFPSFVPPSLLCRLPCCKWPVAATKSVPSVILTSCPLRPRRRTYVLCGKDAAHGLPTETEGVVDIIAKIVLGLGGGAGHDGVVDKLAADGTPNGNGGVANGDGAH